jgi:hypothetical protein
MSSRTMSSEEAKLRAGRAFEKTEQRKRESEQRLEDQRRSDVSAAAKIQRLRAMRLARDEALETQAQAVALEENSLKPKKGAPTGAKPAKAEAKPKAATKPSAKAKTAVKAKMAPPVA